MMANQLGISQPQTSKHLRILYDADLVTVTIDANRRRYALKVSSTRTVRCLADLYGSGNRATRPSRSDCKPVKNMHCSRKGLVHVLIHLNCRNNPSSCSDVISSNVSPMLTSVEQNPSFPTRYPVMPTPVSSWMRAIFSPSSSFSP